MDVVTVVIAILGFGLSCFKIGYSIGKDVSRHEKNRPIPEKKQRL